MNVGLGVGEEDGAGVGLEVVGLFVGLFDG